MKHILRRQQDSDDREDAESDLVADEVLPKCLEALAKVPNDNGFSEVSGCCGLSDRLKRMEMSALTQVPLSSATALSDMVAQLSALWPVFVEDTSGKRM